jgi:hypothetical protein
MSRPSGIHTSSNRGLGLEINAKSGFKGVYFHAGKYMSTIQHKGEPYYLGRFDTAEEASEAYEAKAIELWGVRAAPCVNCGSTWKTKREDLCDECKDKRQKQHQEWLGTPLQRFRTLLRTSKKREMQCLLTFEEYEKASIGPCFYCEGAFGDMPIIGYGLDRLDNEKGYSVDNIVPCCWNCNALKQDLLTPEETKAAVHAILKIRAANNRKEDLLEAAKEVLIELQGDK